MGRIPGATPHPIPTSPTSIGALSAGQTAEGYDFFMGRYSRPLAEVMADRAGLARRDRVLDVGCGPGALTTALLGHVDRDGVWACDPSPDFVADCARLNPKARVRRARAEALPYGDSSFDHVFASLVMHFVTGPATAVWEMARVLTVGGRITLSVWAAQQGPDMLRAFAQAVDDTAGEGASGVAGLAVLRFGEQGALTDLFDAAGCEPLAEEVVTVNSRYGSYHELWAGFIAGVGPAGSYTVALAPAEQEALRAALWKRLGSPPGPFALSASARVGVARVAKTAA